MPIYSIQNCETKEILEMTMSISEKELFLSENPHLKQVFLRFPGIIDSARAGITKPSGGHKEVLSKIKEAHPHGTIDV